MYFYMPGLVCQKLPFRALKAWPSITTTSALSQEAKAENSRAYQADGLGRSNRSCRFSRVVRLNSKVGRPGFRAKVVCRTVTLRNSCRLVVKSICQTSLPWWWLGYIRCLTLYNVCSPLAQATSIARDIEEGSVGLVKTTVTRLGTIPKA